MAIRTTGNRSLTYSNNEHNLTSTAIRDLKNTTALDLSFQSEGRWDMDHKSKFMSNLILGMAPSKIVVADVNKCLEVCETGSYDYEYFFKWKKLGYDYISIDGNNRTITIYKYLNNLVSIKHGDYQLPNGQIIVIDKDNDTWSKHPTVFKKYIEEQIFITVTVYTNAYRQDLTNLFRSINDGITLNAQEFRNSILVYYSEWVRNMTKLTYNDMLIKVFPTVKQKYRRVVDSFIACMSIFTTYGTSKSIQGLELDKAYEDDSTTSQSAKRAEKLIKNFSSFIKRNSDTNLKDSSTLFNLFMTYVFLYDNEYSIVDEKSFYDWFMASENRRIADIQPIVTTKGGESRTYASCNSTMSQLELEGRFKYLIKDISEITGKLIKKKDAIRLFSAQERYVLWKRQNGKCVTTNKIIPESEINDDTKWHADHIVPYSKGGKTSLDNGQLIDRLSNLQKSNKLSLV